MSFVEEHKMIVLSTAHLSPITRDRMNAEMVAFPFWEKGEYGFFVPFVPDENNRLAHADDYPGDLAQVLIWARDQGCTWVMFDRDAPRYDRLPVFED